MRGRPARETKLNTSLMTGTYTLVPLTWPVSEVVWSPGQIVRHVQPIYGSVVVGVVEDGEEQELDGGEGCIVVPEEHGGGRVNHVDLMTNGNGEECNA